MGSTKTSKPLAAKRPRLVPIWDSVVRDLLAPVDNHWEAFRYALADEEMRLFWSLATVHAAEHVSLLRRIDVVLWMIGRSAKSMI